MPPPNLPVAGLGAALPVRDIAEFRSLARRHGIELDSLSDADVATVAGSVIELVAFMLRLASPDR